MKKRIKLTVLIVIMALLGVLSGCGRGGNDNFASKDFIFRFEELPASRELKDNLNIVTAGDAVFMYGTVWDDSYMNSELKLYRITEGGEIDSQVAFRVPSGTYYGTLAGSSDGRIFAVKTVYPTYDEPSGDIGIMPLPVTPRLNSQAGDEEILLEDISEEEGLEIDIEVDTDDAVSRREVSVADISSSYVEDYSYQTEQYYLVELRFDGSERELALLNSNTDLNSMDYFYVNQIFSLPGNRLAVSAMETIALYDVNGSYMGLLNLDLGDNIYGSNYLMLRDGRSIMYYFGDQVLVFREFDAMTGQLGEEHKLEGNMIYSYSIHPGAGYDILLSDYNDVLGYNLGEEPVKLMNYVDSDLSIYSINNIFAIDPEHFWGMIYDSIEGRNYFARFTKVPPEDVVDKINIVLAGSYIDWDIRSRVISFNRANEKYRISLMDYGALYNNNDDWQAGVTRLNTDIVSGRVPDIISITGDIPVQSYMSKGLFADLLPFIEKDPELDVADLLPNVVEAYSMNGKMYRLVPQYYIGTVFGKTSLVGPEPGWTIKDAQALLRQMPPETRLFFDMMTRETILYYAMYLGGDQFIDWEKGECYFDGEGFINLLEFMKDYPEQIDYSNYERMDYWYDMENGYREDRILLMFYSLSNFRDYNRVAKGQFGDDVTMIGFPTESGIGASLSANQSFAMSAKTKHQNAVWEFLRGYLMEDFQTSNMYSLPISRKALEVKAREAMERPYYLDEHNNKVEYDDIYYSNDMQVILEPMTQAEVDHVIDYIMAVNLSGEYDNELVNIINEEVGSFFAGQKSVHDVVNIIQSRAQIYVNENK